MNNQGTEVDLLIEELEVLKKEELRYRERRIDLELQLSRIAESIAGEGRTRRVAGNNHCAKVQFKTFIKWDMRQLETIREETGDQEFGKYFRVAEYKANTRELKKLQNTAGAPEALYQMFEKAKIEVPGKPQVSIEK